MATERQLVALRLRKAGMIYAEIAAKLGVSNTRAQQLVASAAKAKGLPAIPKSKWQKRPNSDYALALHYRRAGWVYREIGEVFGVTACRASQMVSRGQRQALTVPASEHIGRGRPAWSGAKKRLMREAGRRYGAGDLTWQWRDWNEWVATPMISCNDDNTAGWNDLSAPRPSVGWVSSCQK